jgi:CBS domain containing-hemolysin-like protein
VFRRHEDQSEHPPGRRSHKRGSTDVPTGSEATGLPVEGGADAQVEFIIEALGDLRDTVVGEVMTPRVDVVALTIPLTVESVSKAVRESGHSCFPVCGDSLDDLVGMLFVNDLFRAGWTVGSQEEGIRSPGPIDISRRLRQPFLVPESRLVLDVLAEMRRQRRAFAVVVDEHGGVEGVLTVKDLLGALVGDLPDEFDPDEEPEVVRVDGERWLVDGRMSIDDLADQLGVALPEGEYVTLGGYLFDAFGHIPEEGETHELGEWQLRVAEMDKRRIAKVVAKRTPSGPEEADGSDGDHRGNDHTAVG